MTNKLFDQWLAYYDPIHRGWTPVGIANGVCATAGLSFPRIRGGYNLRRSTGGPPSSADRIVGAAGCDATTIRTFLWFGHDPSTTYTYRLCAVNGGGVENDGADATTQAIFDADGNWVGSLPNPPADLRVISLAGGCFLLKWTYSRESGAAEPAEFRIYSAAGAGQIDFGTPTATVPYRPGQFHYQYTSEQYAHDFRVRWVVRAATAAGVEESNRQQTIGWAEAQPPPANPTTLFMLRDA